MSRTAETEIRPSRLRSLPWQRAGVREMVFGQMSRFVAATPTPPAPLPQGAGEQAESPKSSSRNAGSRRARFRYTPFFMCSGGSPGHVHRARTNGHQNISFAKPVTVLISFRTSNLSPRGRSFRPLPLPVNRNDLGPTLLSDRQSHLRKFLAAPSGPGDDLPASKTALTPNCF